MTPIFPTKLLPRLLLVAAAAVLIALLIHGSNSEFPRMERLGDLGSGDLRLELRPQFDAPYDFVLASPGQLEAPPVFHGLLEVINPDGTGNSIALESSTTAHCDWIRDPSVSGFILAWGNRPHLGRLLGTRQTSKLHFFFSVPPPAGSSVWFSSVERTPGFPHVFDRIEAKHPSSDAHFLAIPSNSIRKASERSDADPSQTST